MFKQSFLPEAQLQHDNRYEQHQSYCVGNRHRHTANQHPINKPQQNSHGKGGIGWE